MSVPLLSNFFGNKSTKDIQEVTPLVDKGKIEYEKVIGLSNDELRAQSTKLKEEIRRSIKEHLDQIELLKSRVEVEEDFAEKEKIYAQIDKIEKEVDESLVTKTFRNSASGICYNEGYCKEVCRK